MPLVAGIEEGVALHGPEVVVDLSDEPVLSPSARLLLASRALARGVPYVGADFRFDPPALEPFALPSLAVFGTGKRVGKTAVTGHLARLLAARPRRRRRRDGPRRPARAGGGRGRADGRRPARALARGASRRLGPSRDRGARRRADDRLPALRRRARRARRSSSNVLAGVELAVERASADVVVFDGSGAAIPPVATDRRILVAHDLESRV